MKLALTGATGFVGTRLIEAALASGHSVRALARRPQPDRPSLAWVPGSLEDAASLATLVEGAEAVIHVAGVINAATREGFEAGNVTGTAALLDAVTAAGGARFVHVSSLAAREPQLSAYGASKARSESLVAACRLPFAIVRPPAVYGPGDREMLELFRMARRGFVLSPPAGRLSLVHADDLCRLLLALAEPGAAKGQTIEPDDGRAGGWTHGDLAQALGRAVGTRPWSIPTPRAVLSLGAAADRLVRGARAKLTADRVSYFCHPDWVVDRRRAAPASLWQPMIATEAGLAETAGWYREAGWL